MAEKKRSGVTMGEVAPHYPAEATAPAGAPNVVLVVFDDTVDMLEQARFAMEFCAIESCGKCTPCRIGSTRGVETMDKIMRGDRVDANVALVTDLCNTLKFGSLCALGGFTPYPVTSALKHFPEDFKGPRLAAAAE